MFRASILPYILHDNTVYFGLGLDSRYNEITDFGGRVDFYDKNHYSTALREFQEETSSPLDFVDDCIVEVKNEHHQVYICKTRDYIMNNYIQHISNMEISKGFIIRWDEFISLLEGKDYKGYKLWESLLQVLKENIKLVESLLPPHVERNIHSP